MFPVESVSGSRLSMYDPLYIIVQMTIDERFYRKDMDVKADFGFYLQLHFLTEKCESQAINLPNKSTFNF